MDKRIQADVLSNFHSGKISDVYETEKGIMLTINMTEYNTHPYAVLNCMLINCQEFLLELMGDVCIKDLQEIKKYKIEMENAEFRNNKLIVSCLIEENWAKFQIETENIRIYDELDREISLLDFSIISGLCSSGAGITFSIGNSLKEAQFNEKYVKFNEELQEYLRYQEQYRQPQPYRGPKKENDLLIGLDEYGTKIFTLDEIVQLIKICDGLLNKYSTNCLNDQKIRYFAEKLKELCEEAKLEDKLIVAVGD
ncbi:hypothetical protein JNUCC23_23040 (plasmid) [Peribacillus sp. JNUCC 23]